MGPYAVVDKLALESSPFYYSVTLCLFLGPLYYVLLNFTIPSLFAHFLDSSTKNP